MLLEPMILRKEGREGAIASRTAVEALELLIERLGKTLSNGEFLAKMSQL